MGSACSQMPPAASSELLGIELDMSGRTAATAVQTCPEVNSGWGEECLLLVPNFTKNLGIIQKSFPPAYIL